MSDDVHHQNVARMLSTLERVDGQYDTALTQVGEARTDVAQMRQQFNQLRTEVALLRSDVNKLRQELLQTQVQIGE